MSRLLAPESIRRVSILFPRLEAAEVSRQSLRRLSRSLLYGSPALTQSLSSLMFRMLQIALLLRTRGRVQVTVLWLLFSSPHGRAA